MTERVIRKRVVIPSAHDEGLGVLFEPGDILTIASDGETKEERWLVDVMAIAGPTGQMRRVHEKCLDLAPYQMLHSETCQEPGVWQ